MGPLPNHLTREEADELAQLLDKARWPLPINVFYAILRKTIAVAVELAVLRHSSTGFEILLTQRPPEDPYYANMWHLPGKIVQPGKTKIETLRSLLREEVATELEKISSSRVPQRYEYENPNGKRGPVIQYLHSLELTYEEAAVVTVGGFFPLNRLPEPLVASHIHLITWLRQQYPQESGYPST